MIVGLLIPLNAVADIRFNNRTYIACDTCTTDLQYMAAAESHHMELFGVDTLQARDLDVYVVLNESSGQFKTVVLRRIYETLFVRFPNTQARILSHISANVVSNASTDNVFFNQYNAFEFSDAEPSELSVKPNWFSIGKINAAWLADGDFILNNRAQINAMVNSAPINPFLFAASPMKFYLKTSDGFKVTIVNTNMFENYFWMVAFASKLNNTEREYFDHVGNLINKESSFELPNSIECFSSMFSDVCRQKPDYWFTGNVYFNDRFSAVTDCGPGTNKVCPIRPPECLPGSQTCTSGE